MRLRPTGNELGVAAISAGVAFAIAMLGASGQSAAEGVLLLVMAVLGALTADTPERSAFARALAACVIGLIAGSLFQHLAQTSLLALAFALGRAGRVVVLENARSRREAAALVAEERAQIARDLHDVVAHSLGVMLVQVHGAERVMEGDPAKARAALQAASAVGRDALDEMHRMVGVMRGGGDRRQAQPGLADLPALVHHAAGSGVTVGLEPPAPPAAALALPAGVQLAAYRIAQEALTNVVRHAPDGHAVVRLDCRPEGLELEVVSWGGRSRTASSGGGYGVVGMRERASVYGGTVDARQDGDRFLVTAWLPAKKPR